MSLGGPEFTIPFAQAQGRQVDGQPGQRFARCLCSALRFPSSAVHPSFPVIATAVRTTTISTGACKQWGIVACRTGEVDPGARSFAGQARNQ